MRIIFVFFLLSAFCSSTLWASAKKKWSCFQFLKDELNFTARVEAESQVFRALSVRRLEGIESERLLLKPLDAGDQAAMEALIYAGAPGYFLESSPENDSSQVAFILSWALSREVSGRSTTFAIYDRKTQNLIGMVDLSTSSLPYEFSLGYIVAPEFKDQGFASEAVQVLVKELRPIAAPGMSIKSRAKVDNPASWHVLEKAGFKREATDTYKIDGTVLHRYRLSF